MYMQQKQKVMRTMRMGHQRTF